jgi:hypothetical protein
VANTARVPCEPCRGTGIVWETAETSPVPGTPAVPVAVTVNLPFQCIRHFGLICICQACQVEAMKAKGQTVLVNPPVIIDPSPPVSEPFTSPLIPPWFPATPWGTVGTSMAISESAQRQQNLGRSRSCC